MRPKVLVITGYGINSDLELAHSFALAGAEAVRVHINDLIDRRLSLADADILAFPGGFSFGDHIASGRVFANKLRCRLGEDLLRAMERRMPMIGICNGFQVLVKLGLLPGAPGAAGFAQTATLTHNDSGRFEDRWCRLRAEAGSPCLWTKGLDALDLPVRHGEGKFIPKDAETLDGLRRRGQVCLRYADPAGGEPAYPADPNGSVDHIAGVCTPDGTIFGLMPHPEAFHSAHHHPHWSRLGLDPLAEGAGLRIFRNAVDHVRG